MNELKIDSGIPAPPRRRKNGAVVDALRKLNVGDSFVLTTEFGWTALYSLALRAGVKITTRHFEEGGVKKLRIWRAE